MVKKYLIKNQAGQVVGKITRDQINKNRKKIARAIQATKDNEFMRKVTSGTAKTQRLTPRQSKLITISKKNMLAQQRRKLAVGKYTPARGAQANKEITKWQSTNINNMIHNRLIHERAINKPKIYTPTIIQEQIRHTTENLRKPMNTGELTTTMGMHYFAPKSEWKIPFPQREYDMYKTKHGKLSIPIQTTYHGAETLRDAGKGLIELGRDPKQLIIFPYKLLTDTKNVLNEIKNSYADKPTRIMSDLIIMRAISVAGEGGIRVSKKAYQTAKTTKTKIKNNYDLYQLNKKFANKLITKENYGKLAPIIKDLGLEIQARPIQGVIGVKRGAQGSKGSVTTEAIEFKLGKPTLIKPQNITGTTYLMEGFLNKKALTSKGNQLVTKDMRGRNTRTIGNISEQAGITRWLITAKQLEELFRNKINITTKNGFLQFTKTKLKKNNLIWKRNTIDKLNKGNEGYYGADFKGHIWELEKLKDYWGEYTPTRKHLTDYRKKLQHLQGLISKNELKMLMGKQLFEQNLPGGQYQALYIWDKAIRKQPVRQSFKKKPMKDDLGIDWADLKKQQAKIKAEKKKQWAEYDKRNPFKDQDGGNMFRDTGGQGLQQVLKQKPKTKVYKLKLNQKTKKYELKLEQKTSNKSKTKQKSKQKLRRKAKIKSKQAIKQGTRNLRNKTTRTTRKKKTPRQNK